MKELITWPSKFWSPTSSTACLALKLWQSLDVMHLIFVCLLLLHSAQPCSGNFGPNPSFSCQSPQLRVCSSYFCPKLESFFCSEYWHFESRWVFNWSLSDRIFTRKVGCHVRRHTYMHTHARTHTHGGRARTAQGLHFLYFSVIFGSYRKGGVASVVRKLQHTHTHTTQDTRTQD